MSKIQDLSIKKCIAIPSVFCDLYNGGIFGGKQLLHPSDLQSLPGESYEVFLDKNNKKKAIQRYRDIIYSGAIGGHFVILPIENQQEVHYGMVIRNMLYDALTYTEQLEKLKQQHREKKDLKISSEFLSGVRKEDRINPIIPLVFYYGEEPWDAGTDLHSILEIPNSMKKYRKFIPNYRLNVVHAGNINPKYFKTGLREAFELLQFAKDKIALNKYLEEHNQRFSNVDDETSDMILLFLGGKQLMGKNKEKYKSEGGKYNMCTAFKEMVEEGRLLGFRQGEECGIEQGIEQGIKVLILDNIEEGADKEKIILKLKKNFNLKEEKCLYFFEKYSR